MTTISIDGKDYETEKMSEELRSQIISLQYADNEISRAQMNIALLQTARIGYSKAVKELLEKEGL